MALFGITPGMMEKKDFEGYEPGVYTAQIVGIESKTTSTGKSYWRINFKGDFGRIGLSIFDTAYGRQDLYKLFVAVGIDPKRTDVDTEELEDKYVDITIEEIEPYNDKRQWGVVDINEAGGSSESEGTSADEEDEWD